MRTMRKILSFAVAAASFAALSAASAATLDTVKSRGHLACGVSQGLPGFSSPDDKGNWSGLDVDYCRAIAAAIFGDASKVRYTPLSAKERFTALQSGEIDVLSRNTTWTQSRDAGLGLSFAGVIYYDGQGFMVHKSLGVKSARELNGATACMNAGTTTELNLADYFRTHDMKFTPVTFEKSDETVAAYDAGRCDVYSTDQSGLYAERLKLKKPDDHVILPEIISKEPLGPSVRQGDNQWFNLARWVLFAMLDAEELGVTSKNVDAMAKESKNPEIRRLLGAEGKFGASLGVDEAWVVRIVKQVGNYGESFDRNLGIQSRLKIERGLNRLWTQGGLMYAPPVR